MPIAIVPFTRDLEPAVQRFNSRMRDGKAPSSFLLPERAGEPRTGVVRSQQFIAVDGLEVRGGIIILEHPAHLDVGPTPGGGATRERVVNLQSPLSEAIIDSRYAMVSIQLIRFAVKHCARAYVVGMGSMQHPLPRLLRASGWSVRPVPFFFRILRPSRALRELQPLRRTPALRMAAAVGAFSGLAAAALAVMQRSRASVSGLRAQVVKRPDQQGGEEDDATWRAVASRLSFGVARDQETLPRYVWPQVTRYRVYRDQECVGWFSLLVVAMRGNNYFGNLRVATLVDVLARDPGDTAPLAALAARQAREEKCDLIVSNQLHTEGQAALRRAGFLTSRSNYLLATSKALSEEMRDDTSLVSRQDGDGLTNLREK